MNRRELFKGLAAAFVAANIPLPVEQLLAAPDSDVLRYLRYARSDLLHKIICPPCIMHEDGRIEVMKNPDWPTCLQHFDTLIKEYST